MSNSAVAGKRGSKLGQAVAAASTLVRFLFADRLGLVVLAWIALAFIVRPALLDAHYTVAGHASDWLRGRMDKVVLARTAGFVQWASLMLLVLAAAMLHVRVATAYPAFARSWTGAFAIGSAWAWASVSGFLAFVWTPTTAVSMMLHDTFIFFDAIHRIQYGQRPSVDFPTSLGAAVLYLPALSAWLIHGYAGAIELSNAFVGLLLCLVCALACARRHAGFVTAVLVGTVFLMIVPSMLEGWRAADSLTLENGETSPVSGNFAQAMFYNRWGWGALVAMFCFLATRREEGPAPLIEIIVQGAVLAFLFYVKLSYFVVAGASCCLYAYLGSNPLRTLAWGGGVAAAGILLFGLLAGNLLAYIGDVIYTARVSGSRIAGLAELVRENLAEMLISLSPIVLMVLLGKAKRDDWLVAGVIFLGTLFVINQNAQSSGMPTLLCLTAYAIWRLREDANRALRLAAVIAFAIPAAGLVLERASGLMGHTIMTRVEEIRPPSAWGDIPALRHVYVREREDLLKLYEAANTQQEKVDAFVGMAMLGRRQVLRSGEYLARMVEGMDDLRSVLKPGESVAVMDFSSPLGFLMNARPAKGYWITFDDDRTISETVHPSGEELFHDVDHVMMPKVFVEPDTANRLRMLYADYLAGAYADRVETAHWVRFSHRKDRLVLRGTNS